MQLSEAIRLGSMLKPQATNALREDGKSCALGAACDALGVPMHDDDDFCFHALHVEYPALLKPAKCPACGWLKGAWRRWREHEYDLEDVLIHLNDEHEWTRERIADWLTMLEPVAAPSLPSMTAPVGARHGA